MCKQATERQFELSSFQGRAPSQGGLAPSREGKSWCHQEKESQLEFPGEGMSEPPRSKLSASARDCLDDPRKLQQKMGE